MQKLVRTALALFTVLALVGLGFSSLSVNAQAQGELQLREGPIVTGVPGQDYVADEVIVKFKEWFQEKAQGQLHTSLKTQVVHSSQQGGFKVLKTSPGKTVQEMVDAYRQNPNVEYAEPNHIYRITWQPNDPGFSVQWHLAQIGMASAWDLDTTAPNYGGDPSIIVAVLDTGVAYETYGPYVQAPDLANTNFWTNSDEIAGNGVDDDGNGYIDDVKGWDFANNDAHPNDDESHGTHVTGTIAQSTNNGLGVSGIAFNTTIMPVKVLSGSGSGTDAWIADGLHYAADNGANVINMSLGGSSSTTLQNAIAYARNAGVLIIAAAGNEYQEGN